MSIESGPWGQRWEDEFLRGQRDAREGKPHQDRSEPYNRGYSAETHLQNFNDWISGGKYGKGR